MSKNESNENNTDKRVHHDLGSPLGLPVTRRSLLNESKVEYATHGVNHVQGCSHNCVYCYARTEAMHHGRVCSHAEWKRPRLVADAVEQVRRELAGKRKPVARVHLSFTTDSFMWDAEREQPVEEIAEATLGIIRAINEHGVPVTVLTKGIYPEIDVRSLHPDNHYGITVVSLSEDFRKDWEPGTPPVSDRIAGLRRIAERAAWTWVSVEPYPTPNIDPTASRITPLLGELDFADKFIFGGLNYTPAVSQYLKRVDPDFYLTVAREIELWCRTRGKGLHIKKKTPLHREETLDILSAGNTRKILVVVEKPSSEEPVARPVRVNVVRVPVG